MKNDDLKDGLDLIREGLCLMDRDEIQPEQLKKHLAGIVGLIDVLTKMRDKELFSREARRQWIEKALHPRPSGEEARIM
jgi:hypothetical protein